MIQIDIKKPSMCRLTDEEGHIHKCPFLNGEYECILQGCISYWTWERQYKNCPLHEVTDTDTISRQAAIDAMEGVDWYHINKDGQLTHGANSKEDEPLYKAKDVYKVLNDMPSAQPEIVRCKDCEYGEQDEYGRWYCRSFGCQVGDEDGSGFCSDAERKNNV